MMARHHAIWDEPKTWECTGNYKGVHDPVHNKDEFVVMARQKLRYNEECINEMERELDKKGLIRQIQMATPECPTRMKKMYKRTKNWPDLPVYHVRRHYKR